MSFKETEVGKIPLDWDVAKLGDVADVLSGFAFKSKDFIDNGVPVIKIKNIVPPYVTKDDAVYVSQELYESSEKYQLNYNDILISMTGSNYNQLSSAVGKVGRVRLKDEPMLLNQRVGKIITNEKKCDKEFLYYNISTMETRYRLALSAGGSANQANVSPKQIKSLIIPYPPLDEQKAIAHILSTLDDKIEVNNQINKTLENMAQTIFKQWFVDFEFPNEDGEPYKSSGGEMVESELGLIPLGWKVHLLKDFVPVITGKKNANVATNSGKYKFFTCSQIASKTDDYSFEGKAILVAGNGDFNVKFYNGKFEAYQRTYVLIPHKEDLSGFIYYMMDYNLEEIVTNARGSVISYLTKGDLEDSKIAFPEKENHIQYTVIFQIINEFILNLNKENEKLSELRDTLLPKLMSGEIRVPLDSEGDVS